MEYGLLGEKLGHSFSPRIHKALKGYDYQLLPTPREEVASLFARREFKGLNVTIPYKQTVIPLCDEIDPAAAAIGAVNTVVNRDGKLVGYNTDLDGLLYLARRAGVDMAGKKVLILGSGGTSRTARAAAAAMGAGQVVVISRRGEDNYENLSRHADAQVIINTTPVGMYPGCGQSPVDLEQFPTLTGVLDVVYNPLRTALLMQAEQRGIPCSCGLPMLVAQARRAAELFTGEAISDERADEVLTWLERELENIVLIGMPGCGKSTVGKFLSRSTGKPYVDLDAEIEKKTGKAITEIFAEGGESAFRAIESEVVRETGALTGHILSTGGGVITRPENYAPLHQNGVIVWIQRDIELLSTKDRPLSQANPVQVLWEQRKDKYAAFADMAIENGEPFSATAEALEKELNER